MSNAQRLYRAHVAVDLVSGARVWCHYAYVSEDGEWVQLGDTRWRRTADWFDTEAQAKASKASEVAAIGAKLIDQAQQLLADAKAVPA
jgi:hypothetical protein